MGESAQAGGIFAFQVACTSREVGIITVPLFKSLLVKFYVLFGIVGQALYRKNDADAPAAYGSIAKESVRTAGNLFSYFRQFLRGYVVYVYNAQRSPALDMGLLLAARKSDGNGKAGA